MRVGDVACLARFAVSRTHGQVHGGGENLLVWVVYSRRAMVCFASARIADSLCLLGPYLVSMVFWKSL